MHTKDWKQNSIHNLFKGRIDGALTTILEFISLGKDRIVVQSEIQKLLQ